MNKILCSYGAFILVVVACGNEGEMGRMTANKQTNNLFGSDRFYGENSFGEGERDTWSRMGEGRLP